MLRFAPTCCVRTVHNSRGVGGDQPPARLSSHHSRQHCSIVSVHFSLIVLVVVYLPCFRYRIVLPQDHFDEGVHFTYNLMQPEQLDTTPVIIENSPGDTFESFQKVQLKHTTEDQPVVSVLSGYEVRSVPSYVYTQSLPVPSLSHTFNAV